MRISSLLGPELEETLRTNPAHAAELAEELHAADLAEVIGGLADEPAGKMVAALPIPAAASALDAMDSQRRVEIFALLDRALAATIADADVGRRAGRPLPCAPRRRRRRPAGAHAQGRVARRPRADSLSGVVGGRPDDHGLRGAGSGDDRRERHRTRAQHRGRQGDDLRSLRRRSQRHDAGRGLVARSGAGARRPADQRAHEPRRHLDPARDGSGRRRAALRALQHAGAAGRRFDAQGPGHRHRRRRGLGLEAGAGRGHHRSWARSRPSRRPTSRPTSGRS